MLPSVRRLVPEPFPITPMGSATPTREVEALGYRFHPMCKSDLLDLLFAPRSSLDQMVLGGANLHGLYMFERVPEYRALLSRPCTTVIVDGMPIVWLLRLLGKPVERVHRTTWVDWFEDALARAAFEDRRVFILGHTPALLQAGLRKARSRWPGLSIEARDGFFDIDDVAACAEVVEAIRSNRPDILFVGMGMPRQEIFVERHLAAIDVPVIGLGGAAFAYFAGDQAMPPRWMGRLGLEWSHRLFKDPRRLAGRYLVEPLLLVLAVTGRLLRGRFG